MLPAAEGDAERSPRVILSSGASTFPGALSTGAHIEPLRYIPPTVKRRHPEGPSSQKLTVSVTRAEQEAWKRAAKYLGVSLSDLVRQSVAYYLRAREQAEDTNAKESGVDDGHDNPDRTQQVSLRELSAAAGSTVRRPLDAHAPPVGHEDLTAVYVRKPRK